MACPAPSTSAAPRGGEDDAYENAGEQGAGHHAGENAEPDCVGEHVEGRLHVGKRPQDGGPLCLGHESTPEAAVKAAR